MNAYFAICAIVFVQSLDATSPPKPSTTPVVFSQIISKAKGLSTIDHTQLLSNPANKQVFDCIQAFKTKVEADSAVKELVQRLSSPVAEPAPTFNQAPIDKLCTFNKETLECVGNAGDSPMKTGATKGLELQKYLCDNLGKEPASKCLHDVKVSEKTKCDVEKCGTLRGKVKTAVDSEITSVAQFDTLLDDTCQYMKCYAECVKPTLVSKCGEDTAKHVHVLVGKAAALVKGAVERLGVNAHIPDSCKALGQGHA